MRKETVWWGDMCLWWQRWGCEHPGWDWVKGDIEMVSGYQMGPEVRNLLWCQDGR